MVSKDVWLDREELENQAYEKLVDEELDRIRSRIKIVSSQMRRLQERHMKLTGRRMEA